MYKNFNLTDKERKEILEQHGKYGYKKPLNESFDDLSDEIEPYSKFESSDELLMSIRDRLANAVQMQEWSMVEEVTSDVFNYVKNKMGDSSEDDRDMPGFEGTMDKLDSLSL